MLCSQENLVPESRLCASSNTGLVKLHSRPTFIQFTAKQQNKIRVQTQQAFLPHRWILGGRRWRQKSTSTILHHGGHIPPPIIAQKGINVLILSFLLPPELASLCLVGKFSGGCNNVREETIPQIGAHAAMECCTDKHGILFQHGLRDASITILAQAFCPSGIFPPHLFFATPTCHTPCHLHLAFCRISPHAFFTMPPPLTLRAAPTRIPPPLPHTSSAPSPAPPPHIIFCCRARPRKIIWTLPSNPGDKDWDGARDTQRQ